MERDRALFLAEFGDVPRGLARRIGVAEHLDVTAEGNDAEFPAGFGPIGPAENFLAEADGEGLDPHAVAPRDQKMAHLVHEDERGQDNQKGQNRDDELHGLGIHFTVRSHGYGTI